jgi:hypothetical protein
LPVAGAALEVAVTVAGIAATKAPLLSSETTLVSETVIFDAGAFIETDEMPEASMVLADAIAENPAIAPAVIVRASNFFISILLLTNF